MQAIRKTVDLTGSVISYKRESFISEANIHIFPFVLLDNLLLYIQFIYSSKLSNNTEGGVINFRGDEMCLIMQV